MNRIIKYVLIDIDDTLLDFAKCSEEAIRVSMKDAGIEYRDGMMDTFHRINNSLWARVEQGVITVSELYDIRWDTVFAAMDVSYDGKAFEKLFRHYLHFCAVPVDGARELLKHLHGKYKVYAASNAPYEQQRIRLEKASMLELFDGVFTSELLGVSKPHKEFFKLCLERMNATADETAMIGDSISSDIRGGAESGLFTCWFNIRSKELPKDVKPDVIVTTLDEVKRIL